jgi:hypothetical protein
MSDIIFVDIFVMKQPSKIYTDNCPFRSLLRFFEERKDV